MDEGKTLVSQKVVNCFKGEDAYRYDSDSQKLILAVPVKSPEVNQVQGAMMIMASSSEVTSTIRELEQKGILIIGIIVVLAIFLGYILSTVLVKPFARVTKAIEDLTDGYQNEEISVPDYTETALITDAFNKMLSRMKTLDESRQEFVSNVSHELKTPLTSISGFAEIIQDGLVKEEDIKKFAGRIYNEAQRLITLVEDTIKVSQLDEGENPYEWEKLDAYTIVKDVCGRLREVAEKKNVHLYIDGGKTMFTTVHPILDEVIYNLCDNGIKYNKEDGTVSIHLRDLGENVEIRVKDNGIGIPAEDQSRVFERLYRVDKSHSKAIGGTGLGLSIVKHGVTFLGGTLKMVSEIG